MDEHHVYTGSPLVVLLIVWSCAGCGNSPTSPSTPVNPSGPIHDTLNATGNFGDLDGWSSERSGGLDRQVYDDFMSPTAATIRTVVWQGIRFTARPPTSIYISFIADNNGYPLLQTDETKSGRPRALYAETFSIDRVNERLRATRGCDNNPQVECGSYDYSVTLTAPFTAAATTRYWVLIQAESPLSSMSGWSWRKGQRDNAVSFSNIGSTFPWDFAFALRP